MMKIFLLALAFAIGYLRPIQGGERCRSKLIATASRRNGLGHRVMGLLASLQVANVLHTPLYLEKEYWATSSNIHSMKNKRYKAERFFPLPVANISLSEMNQLPVIESISEAHIWQSRRCNQNFLIGMSGKHSCETSLFCSTVPGLYDLGSQILGELIPSINPKETLNKQEHLMQALRKNDDKKLGVSYMNVFWHLRTGDTTVPVTWSAMLNLKNTIDSLIQNHKPRHVILTHNASQACQHLHVSRDLLSSLYNFEIIDRFEIDEVIDLLIAADIVVSLGSSSSYIAPLLKTYKKLVHFYFPPKEIYWGGRKVIPVIFRSESDVTKTASYRAYFIRKGVVPVMGTDGSIFSGYIEKMKLMISYIDNGGEIPLRVSMISKEKWRPLHVSFGGSRLELNIANWPQIDIDT